MEDGKLPRSNRKRPYLEELEDDEPSKSNKQKRVRFPKGKKVKPGEEPVAWTPDEEGPSDKADPRKAAKERANRRSQITTELFDEEANDASAAEVAYKDNENFVEDGIQIEPFNLDKEREEGYFDEQGNFVEYVSEKEIKDAWLDSVEVDPRYAGISAVQKSKEVDDGDSAGELSSEDIGKIKRRIANLLEPGETVLQALRRLKGGSNKTKEKMSAENQQLFDQLTEDANRLLDHGEYNVYHDKQEVFRREAEGYERLALARGKGTILSEGKDNSSHDAGKDLLSDVSDIGASSSVLPDAIKPNGSTAEVSSNDADELDMFAEDDDNTVGKPSSSGPSTLSQNGASETDYVYDETSGYYYSSSLGYYYDPSSGLYCNATSGQWYSFNEETGTYDEVHDVASNATEASA
ncbi:hypothetical protein Tsubulata_009526 [Turnera subulata]|uniref:OCRE domain-containing protein n=1 Tax=Turnera subulata TaxID=218843 RepID=A0A9Q0FJ36_9ROSI|nr:hypothetical protein Tsubulata_009526 [Turnera subulata]